MNTVPSRLIAGILWMIATGVMFVCVTAVVKYIGDVRTCSPKRVSALSSGVGLFDPHDPPNLKARLSRRQVAFFSARGFVHTLAVILWFYAMARIPIADVTAMNYLSPVYVSIGAALFLGESLPPRRLAAVS